MNYFFDESINEAKKSLKNDDVPVGAVIVRNNKILAKGHNTRVKKNNALNHAEINVIIKACKKLKKWNLNDCDLYITLRPCSMCESIINNSRIRNVYYLLEKPENKKEYKSNFQQTNVCDKLIYYNAMLNTFFKKKRK